MVDGSSSAASPDSHRNLTMLVDEARSSLPRVQPRLQMPTTPTASVTANSGGTTDSYLGLSTTPTALLISQPSRCRTIVSIGVEY
jgi:hypothetical protein